MKNLNAVSLFSSSGIGDLGLAANNIKTVVGNELLPERMKLFSQNYKDAKCFCGNIWDLKDEIIQYYKDNFSENPFMLIATPPCQGMSPNGMGKMLNEFRNGRRPEVDERNRLILPALDIIKALEPEWVILENVPNMTNTMIYNNDNNLVNIIDHIFDTLGDEYVGVPSVIDAADYGVPQHRKRLITVLTRTNAGKVYFKRHKKLIPEYTHSEKGSLITKHWVTLREAIGNFPPIRAEKGLNKDEKFNPLHKVPILDEKKLFWIDNTPEGDTAFNNQCVNPSCRYQGNALHGSNRKDGINQSKTDTPLFCERCGSLLPRPYVENVKTGERRLMKGFVSAYKRMSWDEPASTLTQNFQYACSDNKVHPSQGRVLSLYEGLVLQGITNYPYDFVVDGKMVSDGLIKDTIGESVSPVVIDAICKFIVENFKK